MSHRQETHGSDNDNQRDKYGAGILNIELAHNHTSPKHHSTSNTGSNASAGAPGHLAVINQPAVSQSTGDQSLLELTSLNSGGPPGDLSNASLGMDRAPTPPTRSRRSNRRLSMPMSSDSKTLQPSMVPTTGGDHGPSLGTATVNGTSPRLSGPGDDPDLGLNLHHHYDLDADVADPKNMVSPIGNDHPEDLMIMGAQSVVNTGTSTGGASIRSSISTKLTRWTWLTGIPFLVAMGLLAVLTAALYRSRSGMLTPSQSTIWGVMKIISFFGFLWLRLVTLLTIPVMILNTISAVSHFSLIRPFYRHLSSIFVYFFITLCTIIVLSIFSYYFFIQTYIPAFDMVSFLTDWFKYSYSYHNHPLLRDNPNPGQDRHDITPPTIPDFFYRPDLSIIDISLQIQSFFWEITPINVVAPLLTDNILGTVVLAVIVVMAIILSRKQFSSAAGGAPQLHHGNHPKKIRSAVKTPLDSNISPASPSSHGATLQDTPLGSAKIASTRHRPHHAAMHRPTTTRGHIGINAGETAMSRHQQYAHSIMSSDPINYHTTMNYLQDYEHAVTPTGRLHHHSAQVTGQRPRSTIPTTTMKPKLRRQPSVNRKMFANGDDDAVLTHRHTPDGVGKMAAISQANLQTTSLSDQYTILVNKIYLKLLWLLPYALFSLIFPKLCQIPLIPLLNSIALYMGFVLSLLLVYCLLILPLLCFVCTFGSYNPFIVLLNFRSLLWQCLTTATHNHPQLISLLIHHCLTHYPFIQPSIITFIVPLTKRLNADYGLILVITVTYLARSLSITLSSIEFTTTLILAILVSVTLPSIPYLNITRVVILATHHAIPLGGVFMIIILLNIIIQPIVSMIHLISTLYCCIIVNHHYTRRIAKSNAENKLTMQATNQLLGVLPFTEQKYHHYNPHVPLSVPDVLHRAYIPVSPINVDPAAHNEDMYHHQSGYDGLDPPPHAFNTQSVMRTRNARLVGKIRDGSSAQDAEHHHLNNVNDVFDNEAGHTHNLRRQRASTIDVGHHALDVEPYLQTHQGGENIACHSFTQRVGGYNAAVPESGRHLTGSADKRYLRQLRLRVRMLAFQRKKTKQYDHLVQSYYKYKMDEPSRAAMSVPETAAHPLPLRSTKSLQSHTHIDHHQGVTLNAPQNKTQQSTLFAEQLVAPTPLAPHLPSSHHPHQQSTPHPDTDNHGKTASSLSIPSTLSLPIFRGQQSSLIKQYEKQFLLASYHSYRGLPIDAQRRLSRQLPYQFLLDSYCRTVPSDSSLTPGLSLLGSFHQNSAGQSRKALPSTPALSARSSGLLSTQRALSKLEGGVALSAWEMTRVYTLLRQQRSEHIMDVLLPAISLGANPGSDHTHTTTDVDPLAPSVFGSHEASGNHGDYQHCTPSQHSGMHASSVQASLHSPKTLGEQPRADSQEDLMKSFFTPQLCSDICREVNSFPGMYPHIYELMDISINMHVNPSQKSQIRGNSSLPTHYEADSDSVGAHTALKPLTPEHLLQVDPLILADALFTMPTIEELPLRPQTPLDFMPLRVLGQGSYGTVILCEHVFTKAQYALKISHCLPQQHQLQLTREQIHESVVSPNISLFPPLASEQSGTALGSSRELPSSSTSGLQGPTAGYPHPHHASLQCPPPISSPGRLAPVRGVYRPLPTHAYPSIDISQEYIGPQHPQRNGNTCFTHAITEKEVLECVDHPNVMTLYGTMYTYTDHNMSIVPSYTAFLPPDPFTIIPWVSPRHHPGSTSPGMVQNPHHHSFPSIESFHHTQALQPDQPLPLSMSEVILIQEYFPFGDLYAQLSRHGPLSVEALQTICVQCALALDYLHRRGILYRDLKPENILLVDGDLPQIVLTDFGLSKICEDYGSDRIQHRSNGGVIGSASHHLPSPHAVKVLASTSVVGTPEYMSPELLTQELYTQSTDYYSLGVVLFELATGQPPFYHQDTRKLHLKTVYDPVVMPNFLHPLIQSLLHELLHKEGQVRIQSLYQLQSHPFLAFVDWSGILRSCEVLLCQRDARNISRVGVNKADQMTHMMMNMMILSQVSQNVSSLAQKHMTAAKQPAHRQGASTHELANTSLPPVPLDRTQTTQNNLMSEMTLYHPSSNDAHHGAHDDDGDNQDSDNDDDDALGLTTQAITSSQYNEPSHAAPAMQPPLATMRPPQQQQEQRQYHRPRLFLSEFDNSSGKYISHSSIIHSIILMTMHVQQVKLLHTLKAFNIVTLHDEIDSLHTQIARVHHAAPESDQQHEDPPDMRDADTVAVEITAPTTTRHVPSVSHTGHDRNRPEDGPEGNDPQTHPATGRVHGFHQLTSFCIRHLLTRINSPDVARLIYSPLTTQQHLYMLILTIVLQCPCLLCQRIHPNRSLGAAGPDAETLHGNPLFYGPVLCKIGNTLRFPTPMQAYLFLYAPESNPITKESFALTKPAAFFGQEFITNRIQRHHATTNRFGVRAGTHAQQHPRQGAMYETLRLYDSEKCRTLLAPNVEHDYFDDLYIHIEQWLGCTAPASLGSLVPMLLNINTNISSSGLQTCAVPSPPQIQDAMQRLRYNTNVCLQMVMYAFLSSNDSSPSTGTAPTTSGGGSKFGTYRVEQAVNVSNTDTWNSELQILQSHQEPVLFTCFDMFTVFMSQFVCIYLGMYGVCLPDLPPIIPAQQLITNTLRRNSQSRTFSGDNISDDPNLQHQHQNQHQSTNSPLGPTNTMEDVDDMALQHNNPITAAQQVEPTQLRTQQKYQESAFLQDSPHPIDGSSPDQIHSNSTTNHFASPIDPHSGNYFHQITSSDANTIRTLEQYLSQQALQIKQQQQYIDNIHAILQQHQQLLLQQQDRSQTGTSHVRQAVVNPREESLTRGNDGGDDDDDDNDDTNSHLKTSSSLSSCPICLYPNPRGANGCDMCQVKFNY